MSQSVMSVEAPLAVDPDRSADAGPLIEYLPARALWLGLDDLLVDLIDRTGAGSVAELGGGANPSVEVVSRAAGAVDLTVIDVSQRELDKAPAGVRSICADLAEPGLDVPARFDLLFSRMLAEHVPSGRQFHQNCLALLRPGGIAVHFSPVLGSLPFLVNRVVPERLAHRALVTLFPVRASDGRHAKFPARYSWCHGPSPAQRHRLEGVGFEPLAFFVGFGHGYYDPIPGLRAVERAKSRALLARPTPRLASYVISVLRRPTETARAGGR